MDNQAYLKILYSKLLTSTINRDELLWLQAYFKDAKANCFQDFIVETLEFSDEEIDTTSEEQQTIKDVYSRIARSRFEVPEKKVYRIWPRIVGIAASVTIVLFSIWFYTSQHQVSNPSAVFISGSHDIAPGSNKATLTLANGIAIDLSNTKTGVVIDVNKLSYTDGTRINDHSRSKNSALNKVEINQRQTISTPRGGTYQITLSDGTKVWLNAASSLTYTTALNEGGVRRVKLVGEGYFEVAKDKKRPFIVTTDKQEVEVLGTHFNIDSYTNEPETKTTLLEGEVRVRHANSGDAVLLKPGEQSVLSPKNLIVKGVDIDEAISWKDGYFLFNNERMTSAMRKLSRWYDIDVVYSQNVDHIFFLGTFPRSNSLQQTLKILEMAGSFKFKIEGRRLEVML